MTVHVSDYRDEKRAAYRAFLESKFKFSQSCGFDVGPEEIHPTCKPHQRDMIQWAVKKGRCAIFARFGLGKTIVQLEIQRLIREREGGRHLVIAPLGVRQEFKRDASMLGLEITFVRRTEEVTGDGLYITNYESVRDGKLDVNLFTSITLDEASVLRSYGSKTYQTFLQLFDAVKYRFVATATPSPNRYKELIHYAGFLGVMDTGHALTRFFQRDSEQAGNLTLYEHMEAEFFLWLHSWALFVQSPADLGYSNEGYDLPPLKVIYHELPTPMPVGKFDRDGQATMIKDSALSLKDAAEEKRDSLEPRVAKMMEIIRANPDDHFILWHDLEAERKAIEAALPGVKSVYGSLDTEVAEARLVAFADGKEKYLPAKPQMSGSGGNYQRHCHKAIFLGIGYKFNDFVQAIHRIFRYLQEHEVEIHIIYTEAERQVLAELQRKWREDDELRDRMSEIIRKHGLSTVEFERDLARTIGCERQVERGDWFEVVNNDSVEEYMSIEDNRFDLLVTSIPFGNHYEYVESYNDFGHNDDHEAFFGQLDFLTPELYRTLRPGRIACIHVKDRIRFGNVTGDGFPTVEPFHSDCIAHYLKHGFKYCGMITVVTDVVRENAGTYRLSYSEMLKDGTKMGVGSPEYVLLFRKPQTDQTKGYADVRVAKSKEEYSLARWQIDAHSFWRSSGNRLVTAEDMARMNPEAILRTYQQFSLDNPYDYEEHVRIGEALERREAMSKEFMCLAPASPSPDVWHDVTRMHTLNTAQSQRRLVKHICLARGSAVLTRERGYVPIQQVMVGEHALTHMGRWRPVLAVQNTGVRPAVTLRAHGVPGLTLTPDHKLWTRQSAWARQRDGAEHTQPGWVEAKDTLGGYLNLKLPPVDDLSLADSLHWWVVGRWIADGHWDARGAAHISCGAHERSDLVERLADYAGGVYDTGTAIQIRLLDRGGRLKDTLSRCGHGARNKHLPPEAFTLNAGHAEALLAGYLSGDGHFLDSRRRYTATTVSRELALGIALLAQRVHGAIASVYAGRAERMATIEGRLVHCRQEWVVCFDIGERRKTPFILGDGAWKKVRSIEDAGEVETWNLRVEEDESFTAEGCIVKNCPLQFDLVDRLIERYSNPGEEVTDPFGGLLTVPYRAILLGRKGHAGELNPQSYRDGLRYVKAAEAERDMPALFDFARVQGENG